MNKTLRFVCDSVPIPRPKWVRIKTQGSSIVCTAVLSAVPLQIQEKLESNQSAEALEAVGFENPRNFLIEGKEIS